MSDSAIAGVLGLDGRQAVSRPNARERPVPADIDIKAFRRGIPSAFERS